MWALWWALLVGIGAITAHAHPDDEAFLADLVKCAKIRFTN